MPVRQAAEVVRKLAEALAYAHQEGVIHRDVKPGNVMMREDGEPLLMDFGLASRGADEAGEGRAMGTPPFMAPEQWAGKAEAASDQYSLGCTLFQLLTGELPFAAGSPDHFRVLHETQLAPSPRTFRAEVPRDLEAICLKCLEKEPGKRYAGCRALADDLRRFLDGEPVVARPLGVGERLVKWARRLPVVASLTAAVMLALTLGAGVASYFAIERNNEAVRANDNFDEAKAKAAEASSNARLVRRTLAKALVGPIASTKGGGPLSPSEVDTFWQVAELRRDDVAGFFLEEITRTPLTCERLESRANFTFQASIGLDPVRRSEWGRLLAARSG